MAAAAVTEGHSHPKLSLVTLLHLLPLHRSPLTTARSLSPLLRRLTSPSFAATWSRGVTPRCRMRWTWPSQPCAAYRPTVTGRCSSCARRSARATQVRRGALAGSAHSGARGRGAGSGLQRAQHSGGFKGSKLRLGGLGVAQPQWLSGTLWALPPLLVQLWPMRLQRLQHVSDTFATLPLPLVGNILESVKAAKQQRVRVSLVGLAAEVHICKVMAQVGK